MGRARRPAGGAAVARLAERRRWRYVELDADASSVLPFDLLRGVHVRWREHVVWGNSRFGGWFEAFDALHTPLDGAGSLSEGRLTCVVTTLPERAERFVVTGRGDAAPAIDLRDGASPVDAELRRHLTAARPDGVSFEVTGTHLLALSEALSADDLERLIDAVLELRGTLPRPAAAIVPGQ